MGAAEEGDGAVRVLELGLAGSQPVEALAAVVRHGTVGGEWGIGGGGGMSSLGGARRMTDSREEGGIMDARY